MGKKYRSNKRHKITSSDWQQLAENERLRQAYLQFTQAIQKAQDVANERSPHAGLPAGSIIDLREAGRILDQYPQLIRYLETVRELQLAQKEANTLPSDMLTRSSPIGVTPQSANLGGWAGYSDRNQAQGVPNARTLRDWVDQSEWATSAITYYCNRVSRADVSIMPYDERKPYNKAIEKTLQGILEHPNPLGDTWPALMSMGIKDYFTLGRMMFSKNMNVKRQALELYAEDASLVRIYPAWDGSNPNTPRYIYTDDNGRTKIPLRNDEIICILDGVATFRFSFSRVQTLRKTIIADLSATEGASRAIDQKPPPVIIQIPGASNEQINTLRSTYSANLEGRRETMFLGGPNPAGIHALGYSLRENQGLEWMEYLARKFAVVFDLSLSHFSYTDKLNRATSNTQKDLSEERGLIPFMLSLEESMNNGFVADYAPKRNGRPDIQSLNLRFLFPEISETARMLHAQETVEVATKSLAGLPSQTINMVLSAMGQDPLPSGGNTFYVNTANGPVPWLSYDNDFIDTRFGPDGLPIGTQDPDGGPAVDDTADDDMGQSDNNQSGNDNSSPDESAETVSPDSSIDTPATAAEKRFKDYRKPGRIWTPSSMHMQRANPEPTRLPEEIQARMQLASTVKRLFGDVEKRAKEQLRSVE